MADEEGNEAVSDEVGVQDSVAEGADTGSGAEEGSGGEPIENEEKTDGAVDTPETSEGFDGTVSVDGHDIPLNFSSAMMGYFDKQGVDIKAVLQGVSDNKGQLTDDMMKDLATKIPAPMLEMIINTHTGKVDDFIKNETQKVEDQRVADNNRAIELHRLAGDEEGFKALMEWAEDADNVPDDVFNGFDKAMKSGDKHLQTLVINDMVARNNAVTGDSLAGLIQSESTEAPTVIGGALTGEQYRDIMKTPEYQANKGKYDAMRRKGHAKGI